MTDSTASPHPPKEPKHGRLTLMIVIAIVLAIVLAFVWPKGAMAFDLGGQIFLRLLQMVVVPLVMASVMSGILGLGDIRKLGRPGGYAILYYMTTTVLAVITGLIVVNIIDPADGIPVELVQDAQTEGERELAATEARLAREDATAETTPSMGTVFKKLVLLLFTDNLLGSMVKLDLLPLIVFSIIFAGMLTTMGKRAEIIKQFVVAINDALMSFIMLLMKIAPLGIFCLVTARFGAAIDEGTFGGLVAALSSYMATVLIGLAIHAFLTLPLLYFLFLRRNPYRFVGKMSEAILTAFSTASSTATLPVTMECAENNAGVSKQSTEFVLPIGATINMDGTALYEAAAAIFIAGAYATIDPSFQLDFVGQMTIAITATLAAIGAAGIPEAGLITLLIVLNAVNLPLALVGLVIPVDWLLDRFRTAVNCFGDAVGAALVDQTFPKPEPSTQPSTQPSTPAAAPAAD